MIAVRGLLPMVWLLALAPAIGLAQPITVTDQTGHTVKLEAPAERIISLAPNTTETLFAAGAGERIVATVSYSDYPEAAREIPRIGSYKRLDLEAILVAEPDLVVGWQSGNPGRQLERLRELGVDVYVTEPRRPADIAAVLQDLGQLAGTAAVADEAAREFIARFETLRALYGGREPVSVFYQVWDDPLSTINGAHMISRVIEGCGGANVFADLSALAPRVGVEAVLERDPEVILASGMGEERPDWLDDWRDWPDLRAVRDGNLYFVPPDIIQRQTLRILEGMERVCAQLEEARGKRDGG